MIYKLIIINSCLKTQSHKKKKCFFKKKKNAYKDPQLLLFYNHFLFKSAMSSNHSSPLSNQHSSPLSEQHSFAEPDLDGEISNELEQLGVDLVDQNDLEKSLMEKVTYTLYLFFSTLTKCKPV